MENKSLLFQILEVQLEALAELCFFRGELAQKTAGLCNTCELFILIAKKKSSRA